MKKPKSKQTSQEMSEIEARLGMNRTIARRDFLNGTAIAITGALGALNGFASDSPAPVSQSADPQNYPPLRSGLRGQYPAAAEIFEALRGGKYAQVSLSDVQVNEEYDLVIVVAVFQACPLHIFTAPLSAHLIAS